MTAKQPPKPKTGTRPAVEKVDVDVTLEKPARMLTVWLGVSRSRNNGLNVGGLTWVFRDKKDNIIGFETLAFPERADVSLKTHTVRKIR